MEHIEDHRFGTVDMRIATKYTIVICDDQLS